MMVELPYPFRQNLKQNLQIRRRRMNGYELKSKEAARFVALSLCPPEKYPISVYHRDNETGKETLLRIVHLDGHIEYFNSDDKET